MALAGAAASDGRDASAAGPAPAKRLKSGNGADSVHESSFVNDLVAMGNDTGPALTAVRVHANSVQARAYTPRETGSGMATATHLTSGHG